MASLVIGLGFRARSGKDTVADMLVHFYGFQKMAFADPLKEAAKVIFGWDDRHVYGDLKEVVDEFWGFTPRWALQRLGTDACRNNIDTNIWVKASRRRIQQATGPVVFTDVRFPNEAWAVKEFGGLLVRIDRPQGTAVHMNSHVSEFAMEEWGDWNVVIDNTADLTALERQVHELAARLELPRVDKPEYAWAALTEKVAKLENENEQLKEHVQLLEHQLSLAGQR